MKIAVIDYFANVGGGRRYTASLVKGLKYCNPEIEIKFVSSKKALNNQSFGNLDGFVSEQVGLTTSETLRAQIPNGRIHGIPGTWRAKMGVQQFLLKTRYALGSQIARAVQDADVLFFAWPDFHVTFPIQKPFALTVHDLIWRHNDLVTQAQVTRLNQNAASLLQRSSAVITLTPSMRREVDEAFPGSAQKTRVIYSPLPELPRGLSSPARDKWLSLQHVRSPFVLVVGGLWAHKNHLTLLQAIARLKQEHTAIQLVCTGQYTDEAFGSQPAATRWGLAKTLRELANNLGLESGKDVIGLGSTSDIELATLYEAATCFVAPSTYEGGSLPMLEAVAHQCPVACSDISVFRDIASYFQLTPRFFVPTNADALATEIARILEQPISRTECKEMAQRVKQRTWRDAAQEYLGVLYEIA